MTRSPAVFSRATRRRIRRTRTLVTGVLAWERSIGTARHVPVPFHAVRHRDDEARLLRLLGRSWNRMTPRGSLVLNEALGYLEGSLERGAFRQVESTRSILMFFRQRLRYIQAAEDAFDPRRFKDTA